MGWLAIEEMHVSWRFEIEMVARLARQGVFVRNNIEVVMVQMQMKVHWIFVMVCVELRLPALRDGMHVEYVVMSMAGLSCSTVGLCLAA